MDNLNSDIPMPLSSRREFLCAAAATTSGAAILSAEFVPETARAGTDKVVELVELVLPPATKAVTPFEVHVPEAALDNLKKRLRETRFPTEETVSDWSQGVPLAKISSLANYWALQYDWRRAERTLNALPQFRTAIDGLGI